MPIEPIDGSLICQILDDGTRWGNDYDGRLAAIGGIIEKIGIIPNHTILDLGSNAGHFPIEYIRMGAKKVIAVEGRPEFERQWNSIKDRIPHIDCNSVEWITDDVRGFKTEKKYSVISYLGLAYHLTDFSGVLSSLITENVELILFETQLWEKCEEAPFEFPTDRTRSLDSQRVMRYDLPSMEGIIARDYDNQFEIYRLWVRSMREENIGIKGGGEASIRALWLLISRKYQCEKF
jgi:hypothetical protein